MFFKIITDSLKNTHIIHGYTWLLYIIKLRIIIILYNIFFFEIITVLL